MPVQNSSDDAFDKLIGDADTPVLVDFWAEWCGPCKQVGPIVDELAQEFGDRLQVLKHNIDEHPESPTRYGVRSIPTLILFQNGEPAATRIGAAPKNELKTWLEENL